MLDFIIGYGPDPRSAGRAAVWGQSTALVEGSRHLERVEELDERFNKLLYIVRAIWAIMEDQGLTSDDPIKKIQELDISDEVEDKTARESAQTCATCDSLIPAGRGSCQVCGAEVTAKETAPSSGF